eukprot:scaffold3226_cov251-Pinguiococcus_pyrenoidosus.AAC.2
MLSFFSCGPSASPVAGHDRACLFLQLRLHEGCELFLGASVADEGVLKKLLGRRPPLCRGVQRASEEVCEGSRPTPLVLQSGRVADGDEQQRPQRWLVHEGWLPLGHFDGRDPK